MSGELKPVQFVIPEAPAHMSAYLINEANPAAVSAAHKICREMRPGALIMLTTAEFDAITNPNEFLAFPGTVGNGFPVADSNGEAA